MDKSWMNLKSKAHDKYVNESLKWNLAKAEADLDVNNNIMDEGDIGGYFPLIPRLQRFYAAKQTTSNQRRRWRIGMFSIENQKDRRNEEGEVAIEEQSDEEGF
ncbi:hypothetical protein ACFE04_024317 [Oxalis oulophora]